jgi:hypothetical protein
VHIVVLEHTLQKKGHQVALHVLLEHILEMVPCPAQTAVLEHTQARQGRRAVVYALAEHIL